MKLKIGLCQMQVVAQKEHNLIKAAALIDEAASRGAQIICLPEIFNGLYNNKSFVLDAEIEGGPSYQFLADQAKNHRVYLIGGSITEKNNDNIYNTCYMFNPAGELIGKHRKVHLFDIDVEGGIRFMESDTLTPGDELTVVDTEYGRFGIAICFDIRFAEWFRLMATEGAKAIFVPAAFNMTTGPAHWELAFRAWALDNQVYMIGCSPARDASGSYVAYGNSLIVDPWGTIIDKLSEHEGVLVEEIDLNRVEQIRNQIPIIKNMRSDLYKLSLL